MRRSPAGGDDVEYDYLFKVAADACVVVDLDRLARLLYIVAVVFDVGFGGC